MKRITVGQKVRKLREAKNLTQAALAKKAGISPITLSRLEGDLNRPKISTLKCLAKVLRVRVIDLDPTAGY